MLTNLLRHDTYSQLFFDGRIPQPLSIRYLFRPLQCRVVIFPLNPSCRIRVSGTPDMPGSFGHIVTVGRPYLIVGVSTPNI